MAVDRQLKTRAPAKFGIKTYSSPLSQSAIMSVRESMSAVFESLQEPYQTIEDRRTLHKKYQSAIRRLRDELSHSSSRDPPLESVWLFAMYEMTVNIDQSDRTWLTHLEGFFALLQEPHNDAFKHLMFYKALQYLTKSNDHNKDGRESDIIETERTPFTIDLSKLRLRTYVFEMEELLHSAEHPRQIDIQRIRGNVKRVYRDLAVVSAHAEAGNAKVLLQIDQLLNPNGVARPTRHSNKLPHEALMAAESIYRSTMTLLPNTEAPSVPLSMSLDTGGFGLSQLITVIWPLYCASTAPGMTTFRREEMRQTLRHIGVVARIPKAMALDKEYIWVFPHREAVARVDYSHAGVEIYGVPRLSVLLLHPQLKAEYLQMCSRNLSARFTFGFKSLAEDLGPLELPGNILQDLSHATLVMDYSPRDIPFDTSSDVADIWSSIQYGVDALSLKAPNLSTLRVTYITDAKCFPDGGLEDVDVHNFLPDPPAHVLTLPLAQKGTYAPSPQVILV
ncbi:uncharacterized protein N0V89_004558 [Didymosphaeria variabile]|uniref:Uncharacterized protein n=1 Tax=Didymosphaeria variabile TaxID=1932322 RepID=A0A9W8XQ43_9PLEO|nr:uncharacterized protein N0V89_004558 [Didymosphaeria variabile]KAJ4356524.1 hypothetical protein N0V89_004558 [Didymosphaeria variabile]